MAAEAAANPNVNAEPSIDLAHRFSPWVTATSRRKSCARVECEIVV
ncbi:hypothetical protein [Bradyrhizobium sp. WSM1253]|nr:hypothetical protein [Bradyrhizobium sp. WSM1253]